MAKEDVVSKSKLEKDLIENFVEMQKVMTNLTEKFDTLTDKISRLLELFEISAKALAGKDIDFEKDNKELKDKLDQVLDQNKVIARGLSIINERPNIK